MASIEVNKNLWDRDYKWLNHGEEWSSGWGGSDMQWFGTILPRIKNFVPTSTILEIAPGHGRWTQFLQMYCQRLKVVDLSENCIEFCKNKFQMLTHLDYFVNDGKSLDMVLDDSIDFVFSFDSLVHAEAEALNSYLKELSKKLKKDGIGFIHHSNILEYSSYFNFVKKIPRGAGLLNKLGVIENNEHLRARSMSAEKFALLCQQNGLRCIGQELVNWSSKRLIDCFSILCKEGSSWERPNVILRNPQFMSEMNYLKNLSPLYKTFSK